MLSLKEPMKDMFSSSKILVLDFREIPVDAKDDENIAIFFDEMIGQGKDPRRAEFRQQFNNTLLGRTGKRYLVSRYGEDRMSMLQGSKIAEEKRTLHLGIDIFSRDLETVYAPCDGDIVMSGSEKMPHGFGNFVIIKPNMPGTPYLFFGHLANDPHQQSSVNQGDVIGRLGDYVDNENGGWSRHLHFQLLRDLPHGGEVPIGYSSMADFADNSSKFPDPMPYFPDWKV